jgi:hypothetical protein
MKLVAGCGYEVTWGKNYGCFTGKTETVLIKKIGDIRHVVDIIDYTGRFAQGIFIRSERFDTATSIRRTIWRHD